MARRRSIYCSFCGKCREEVRDIVAGPSVFICNECVEEARRVMLENAVRAGAKPQLVKG